MDTSDSSRFRRPLLSTPAAGHLSEQTSRPPPDHAALWYFTPYCKQGILRALRAWADRVFGPPRQSETPDAGLKAVVRSVWLSSQGAHERLRGALRGV